ncbi:hypothetical protein [Roseiconus lacunae]|uniref:WYL domain-containing protein n=1 Tax=Roseiconus lacunae TaxID=2605694 RepID=A0ABT7PF53_9BACT|nr:hypothetical protein [Roseiconus lacunae]MCD0460023.1 hypothetical protein [Roseiconus lacunae]MDM4014929.1 hypothetical protein [Roseiconus lacunae]
MIEPGDRLQIHYPDTTLINAIANLKRRKIHVHQIRDLVAEPLTPEEYLRRPLIRRSRWLVSAFDDSCGGWRKFYLGSTTEFETRGDLRLALYEPDGIRPYKLITRGFNESRRDRVLLAKTIMAYAAAFDDHDLVLRVVADDLRKV